MTTFKKYPKIITLGKTETLQLLQHPVTVQEKIDGANASIWLDPNNQIAYGSRNSQLEKTKGLRGFVETMEQNKQQILSYLLENPTVTLYGEWLVKHTINYPQNAYQKFYLFDIRDETPSPRDQKEVQQVAQKLGFEYPKIFVENKKVTLEELKTFVGQTGIDGTEHGEGIIIKNVDFRDKYGDMLYAKMVGEQFAETKKISKSKLLDSKVEEELATKYCTQARVVKVAQKLADELDVELEEKDIPRVIQTVFYDIVEEEIWAIVKKGYTVNFKLFSKICSAMAVTFFKDYLQECRELKLENIEGEK